MADTYRAVIPYESLDPLTIGASGDDDKVSRETLELEIPKANLLAAIYPDEPEPVADATEAARAALEKPVAGPRFSEVLFGKRRVAIVIDNQFRPTPQSKLLPPCSTRSRRPAWRRSSSARTARSSRCRSRTSSRRSGVRTSSGWSGSGSSSSRTSPATPRRTTTSACRRAARPSGSTRRSRAAT